MAEVIDRTSILEGFDQKNHFFEGWSWFKFNDLELALGMALKFYTSMAKGLKAKSQKVLVANSYVCRSYRGKTGRWPFCPPPPLPILSRVKKQDFSTSMPETSENICFYFMIGFQ